MTAPRLPNAPAQAAETAPHTTQPDPADRLAPREKVTVDELELQRIVLRAERHQGHGLTPREIQKLAAGVRQYAPLTFETGTELPSITSQASCGGCGTSVAQRGQLCPVCQSKVMARPRPMFETAPQPTPAYARDRELPPAATTEGEP